MVPPPNRPHAPALSPLIIPTLEELSCARIYGSGTPWHRPPPTAYKPVPPHPRAHIHPHALSISAPSTEVYLGPEWRAEEAEHRRIKLKHEQERFNWEKALFGDKKEGERETKTKTEDDPRTRKPAHEEQWRQRVRAKQWRDARRQNYRQLVLEAGYRYTYHANPDKERDKTRHERWYFSASSCLSISLAFAQLQEAYEDEEEDGCVFTLQEELERAHQFPLHDGYTRRYLAEFLRLNKEYFGKKKRSTPRKPKPKKPPPQRPSHRYLLKHKDRKYLKLSAFARAFLSPSQSKRAFDIENYQDNAVLQAAEMVPLPLPVALEVEPRCRGGEVVRRTWRDIEGRRTWD